MELFTKKIEDDPRLYDKTATIANTVLEEATFHGIMYPSIQNEYKGDCIALRPEVMKEYFELTEVKLYEVKIDPENKKSVFKEKLFALNFLNDKIKWEFKNQN
jgi:vacuolar-type H+-ATPase subunit E/Vma4